MRKSCVFTLQHDEDFYLPMWVKYYSKHFDNQDIYIFAHNPTELTEPLLKSYENIGINVERIFTDEIFNHDWLNDIVHSTQRNLLNNYEYVVFTDCDEIISPVGISLRDFIDNATENSYRCLGFNVVEDKLSRDARMDKTLITKIPLVYEYGYHTSSPNVDINDQIHLYHLHKLNYEKAWNRNLRLSQEKWNSTAVANSLSIQNMLVDENSFKNFFYNQNSELIEYTKEIKNIIKEIYNV